MRETKFAELHKDAARVFGYGLNNTALVDEFGSRWQPKNFVIRQALDRFAGRQIKLVLLDEDEDEQEAASSINADEFSDDESEKKTNKMRFDLIVHLLHLLILLLVKFAATDGSYTRHGVIRSLRIAFETDELYRIRTGAETCDWLQHNLRDGLFRASRAEGSIMSFLALRRGLVFEIKTQRLSSEDCYRQGMIDSCLPENAFAHGASSTTTTVTQRIEAVSANSSALGSQPILLEEQYNLVLASICGPRDDQVEGLSSSGVTVPLLVNDSDALLNLRVQFLIYHHNSQHYAEVHFDFHADRAGRMEADVAIHVFRFEAHDKYSHPAYYKHNHWTVIIFEQFGAYLFVLQLIVLLWRTRQELKTARQSLANYLSSPFHLLESLNLALLYAVLALRITLLIVLLNNNYPERMADPDTPGAYEPMDHDVLLRISTLYQTIDFLAAFALMATSVTVAGYAESVFPRSSPFYLISRTVAESFRILTCLTLTVVYWAAAMGVAVSHFCGAHIARFATYFNSFSTLMRMCAGDDDGFFTELAYRLPSEYLVPAILLWLGLQISFILFVIPLFLSVLNHSYAACQYQTQQEEEVRRQKMQQRQRRAEEARRKTHLRAGPDGMKYAQVNKLDYQVKGKTSAG